MYAEGTVRALCFMLFLFCSSSLDWVLVSNNEYLDYVCNAALFDPRSWGEVLFRVKIANCGLTCYCSVGNWAVKRLNELVLRLGCFVEPLLSMSSFELAGTSKMWHIGVSWSERSRPGAHHVQGETGRNVLFGLKRRPWLRQLNALFACWMGGYKGGAGLLLHEKQWVEVAMWEIPVRC